MTYQDVFNQMVKNIEHGSEFPDALHNAAYLLFKSGVWSYEEAHEALKLDYDNEQAVTRKPEK